MRLYSIVLISLLLIIFTTKLSAVDTSYLQGLGNSQYKKLNSKIVGRNFHIYTMLPQSYGEDSNKNYPTIYLLDGGAIFPMLTAYYRYLHFGEEIPEVIIVGISYGSSDFKKGNLRSTDYTAKSVEREHYGGAETYQKFLSEELFPYIESTYRSDSKQRVLFGQSIAGQFVLYNALTKPDMFKGYIASNPALHRNLSFFLSNFPEHKSETVKPKLFVSNGSKNDKRFNEPALKWIKHWSHKKKLPWILKTTILDGHSHMSAVPAAFRQGTQWIFNTD